MVKRYESTGNGVVVRYTLSDREMEILRTCEHMGYIEFRQYRGEGPDPFNGVTYDECSQLVQEDFLENDDMAWHTTYHLGSMGRIALNGSYGATCGLT